MPPRQGPATSPPPPEPTKRVPPKLCLCGGPQLQVWGEDGEVSLSEGIPIGGNERDDGRLLSSGNHSQEPLSVKSLNGRIRDVRMIRRRTGAAQPSNQKSSEYMNPSTKKISVGILAAFSVQSRESSAQRAYGTI